MKLKHLLLSTIIISFSAVFLLFLGCDDNGNDVKELIVPDNYLTIQSAIDAASDGDEVIVKPGTYPERIDFKGKNITVRSEEPEDPVVVAETIIDGTGQGTVVTFSSGETEDAILWGFTITGGDAGSRNGGGILINNASSPVIKGNIIKENKAAYGAGITVTGGSSPVIEKNEFINNTATSRRGAGIYAIRESTVSINNNIFRDHVGGDGVIHIGGANQNDRAVGLINENTLDNNSTDFGVGAIKVTVHSTASIQRNVITNNTGAGDNAAGAIYVGSDSEGDIVENTITGNKGNRVGAVVVYRNSKASIRNNTITGNAAGTEEDTRYGVGGGIKVTYFAVADISGNTISNNSAWSSNHGGGGIGLHSWGQENNVIISDNVISDNHAARWGGGIYFSNCSQTSVQIDNNIISENSSEDRGGGIYIGNIKEAKIYDNEISDNLAEYIGGGVFIREQTPVFGKGEIPWNRDNSPPASEINNIYSGNSHGNDKCGGADAYFEENWYPSECR